MIIKCVSRKGNIGQLIKYVLTAAKVGNAKGKQDAEHLYIPGVPLTNTDIHHLLAERFDTALLREFKKHAKDGDIKAFIENRLMKSVAGTKGKENTLRPIVIKHNIRSRSINGYIKEFEENEKLRLHVRRDSVKAYHTILSFSHLDNGHITEKMLKDIAQQYISVRGPDSIFLGAVHQDKEHIHIHLIQSGTQYCTGVANRISKQEFQDVKRTMQEYQKDKYPELIHSLPEHGKAKNLKTTGLAAQKNIKSNDRTSSKNALLQLLETTIAKSSSPEHFLVQLREQGHEPYYRNGRLQGLMYEDRKFRFSRLGITEQLKTLENMKARNDKELDSLRQLRGTSKDRLAEIQKKEQEAKAENEIKFNRDALCDDCKKEEADPTYQNPKYYVDGDLDFNKYNEHMLEEVLNTTDIQTISLNHGEDDHAQNDSNELDNSVHDDEDRDLNEDFDKDDNENNHSINNDRDDDNDLDR